MKFSKIVLVIIISGLSLSSFSQINTADKLFEKYNYSKAASFYEKAVDSKKEDIRKHATIRLADCYRLMSMSEKANYWYQKAIEFPDIDPVNYFYLAEALQTQSRYSEAEKMFLKYSELKPADVRAKVYASFCKTIDGWADLPKSADIRNAEELNSVFSEFGPVFYKTGLIFTSDRDLDMLGNNKYLWTGNSYLDLYFSKPKSEHQFWDGLGAAEKMPKAFNTFYHDGPICFSGDFGECYITRTLKTKITNSEEEIYTNKLKIFHADLTNNKPVFKEFKYNSNEFSVGHAAISPNGKMLVFSSDMSGGFGESDLYLTKLKDGNWSGPINLGDVVNSFGNEVFPSWRNDSTLFFASDGHVGYGGLDLFETIKTGDSWSVPRNLKSPINSSYDDFSIVFHPTKNEGFFSSNRPEGKGSDDLYVFQNYSEIPDSDFNETIELSGIVRDKRSGMPLEDAFVYVCQESEEIVFIEKTNEDGVFNVELKKGDSYVIKATQENYFDDCLSLDVSAKEEKNSAQIPRDLLLEKYETNQLIELPNIYYDLNKWNLRADALVVLDELVKILKKNPVSVEIGSHTDSRASESYNKILSGKRAESVRDYLIENGISEQRLTATGYGESMPVIICNDENPCTEEQHQVNRRTEFRITQIFAPGKKNQLVEGKERVPLSDFEDGFFEDCSLRM